MGNNQNSEADKSILENVPERPVTPLSRWLNSQQTTEDIFIFLSTSNVIAQATFHLNHFLKTLTNR